MELRELVEVEIARLKSLDASQIRLLPAVTERPRLDIGAKVSVCVFREQSHDLRTLIVVAAYRRGFIGTTASADGFAIDANGEFVPLSDEERDSLW